MYHRFGTSDKLQIQSIAVSTLLRPTFTLLPDTEIGCTFINVGIGKTVTVNFD